MSNKFIAKFCPFDKVECCFDIVAVFGNKFRQQCMFHLFRLCQEDEISFDIVAKTGNLVTESGNIVAKNGNNVEATFDFVDRIVRLFAFDNVASTLLLVWTGRRL